jgi:uncharacterized membrane protein YbhN (UPF0104 family)
MSSSDPPAPSERPPQPFWRSRGFWLKAALGAFITFGFFVFLFRYVDWKQVIGLQKRTNWWLIAACLPLYEALYMARSARFVLIAPKTPYSVMLCIAGIHNFMLRVLPMRTGELSYAFLVRRAGATGLGESLLGLTLIRLLDIVAVLLFFAVALALNRATFHGDSQLGIWMATGVGAIGLLAVVFFRHLLLLGFTVGFFFLRLFQLTRIARIAKLVDKIGEVVRSYGKMSTRLLVSMLGLTGLVWLLSFGLVFATMRAFGVPISYGQAVLGGTAATVTSFLPIGGIGSFGTLEAGWVLGFWLVGLERGLAVATSFGYSLVTFVHAAILALGSWLLMERLIRRPKEA